MKETETKKKSEIGCLLSGLIGIGIVFGGLFTLTFFVSNCDEDSEAVAYARSLSKERLEKLYYDMERLSTDESLPFGGYVKYSKEEEEFPEPFSDIEAVKVRPSDANIMLEGCFDHYVYLGFEGFEQNKKYEPERQIVLSWGEFEPHAGSEVLWTENVSNKPRDDNSE